MIRSILILLVAFFALVACESTGSDEQKTNTVKKEKNEMELGNFSVSLSVKDIAASRKFYETLGFEVKGGVEAQNWLILRNGSTVIGLFQGMFEGNIMTFNPGWNIDTETLAEFKDVREIQAHLRKAGIKLTTETDENGTGPANITLADPDGNVIFFDQHVGKPGVK